VAPWESSKNRPCRSAATRGGVGALRLVEMQSTAMLSASVRLSKAEEASRRFEMAKKMRREGAAERRRKQEAAEADDGGSSGGLNSNPWLRRAMVTRPAAEPLTLSDARIRGPLGAPLMSGAGCMTITPLLPTAAAAACPRPRSPLPARRDVVAGGVGGATEPGRARQLAAGRCDQAAASAGKFTGSAPAALSASAALGEDTNGEGPGAAPAEPAPHLKAQGVYRCGALQSIPVNLPAPSWCSDKTLRCVHSGGLTWSSQFDSGNLGAVRKMPERHEPNDPMAHLREREDGVECEHEFELWTTPDW
jgi:hypothetical protein